MSESGPSGSGEGRMWSRNLEFVAMIGSLSPSVEG